MILPDVNILVYAHRKDALDHRRYREWVESVINADAAYGMSDLVMSGFLRVVTHPRIFNNPSRYQDALEFANECRDQPNCVPITPGQNHWSIFTRLCLECNAKGNLIPDAYFAAMAIESGCEWITADRDFVRFNGLKWRHPLQ